MRRHEGSRVGYGSETHSDREEEHVIEQETQRHAANNGVQADDQPTSNARTAGTTASRTHIPGRRPKVPRRRQIDPTTCERDYKDDEIEFMTAMDRYKREQRRPFPTCGEVLDVLRSLGYRRDEASRSK